MTQNDIILFFEEYKKGRYTRLTKETNKNGYIKRTDMVCRFVNYYNIKKIKERGAAGQPRPYEETIIPHILKRNKNTGSLLLCVYVTNRHRARSKYYHNDVEISEEEYYTGIHETKRKISDAIVFTFKAEDVVSLGGR